MLPQCCLGCDAPCVQSTVKQACLLCNCQLFLFHCNFCFSFLVFLALSLKFVTPRPVNNSSMVLVPGNHSESNGGNAREALQVVAGADRIAEIQFFFLQGGSVAQCMERGLPLVLNRAHGSVGSPESHCSSSESHSRSHRMQGLNPLLQPAHLLCCSPGGTLKRALGRNCSRWEAAGLSIGPTVAHTARWQEALGQAWDCGTAAIPSSGTGGSPDRQAAHF